jgi:hypothetical protein
MNQIPDRKKLRQEYLKRKASAYFKGTLGAALLVPSLLGFFFFAALTLVLYYVSQGRVTSPLFAAGVVTTTLTIISGVLVPWCWRARHEFRRASEIPFVPPVTADTLPADEILVRGSDEPVAQSDVFLRAAQQGQETAKDELLRVSQGE